MLFSIGTSLLFLFLFYPSSSVIAQTDKTKFTGVVTDSKGTPLIGVTVAVRGTQQKTLTNPNGSFEINAKEKDVLIGYKDQQVTLKRGQNIAVKMSEDVGVLSDVVVVGYGTQRRKDLTGSIVSVDVSEIKKYATSDISQLLQGRASGVAVNSDGQPGASPSVRIRGYSTFGGSQPFYVIDGVPVGTSIRDF